MQKRILGMAALVLACSAGSLSAQPQGSAVSSEHPMPPPSQQKSLALSRVTSNIPVGERVGGLESGLFCITDTDLYWAQGRLADVSGYEIGFARELKQAGFNIKSPEDNLFEEVGSNSDYAVGAIITDVMFTICETRLAISLKAKMSVEWQVYSRFDRKVIAALKTTSNVNRNGRIAPEGALRTAFDENVRALQALPAFRALVVGPTNVATPSGGTSNEVLVIHASPTGPRPLEDALGSVVTVLAGSGQGSGFLISEDGYVLTNQHVVGDVQTVKIRWSDGLERVGQVIRSDRRRDVALIKTEARSRVPFSLRITTVQPGQTVYAIGTPVDERYNGTITKGIASANRILDGFSFIQSDVAVNPGNSGGPLLDEQSRVVGITVHKDQRGGDLNFFIPIGDALDFLAIKVQ